MKIIKTTPNNSLSLIKKVLSPRFLATTTALTLCTTVFTARPTALTTHVERSNAELTRWMEERYRKLEKVGIQPPSKAEIKELEKGIVNSILNGETPNESLKPSKSQQNLNQKLQEDFRTWKKEQDLKMKSVGIEPSANLEIQKQIFNEIKQKQNQKPEMQSKK